MRGQRVNAKLERTLLGMIDDIENMPEEEMDRLLDDIEKDLPVADTKYDSHQYEVRGGLFKVVYISKADDFVVATDKSPQHKDKALRLLHGLTHKNRHIPDVFDRRDAAGTEYFLIKKYTMPLDDERADPGQVAFLKVLRQEFKRISWDQDVVAGHREITQLCSFLASKETELYGQCKMIVALIVLAGLCLSSGERWGIEIQDNNLGLDGNGNIVFVDCIFDQAEVHRIIYPEEEPTS